MPIQSSEKPSSLPPVTQTIPKDKMSQPDAPLITSQFLPISSNEKYPSTAKQQDLNIHTEKFLESKPPAAPAISDTQWPEQSIENDSLLSSWKDLTDDRSEYGSENASFSPSEKSDCLDLEEGVIEAHKNDKKSIVPNEGVDDEQYEQGEPGLVVRPTVPEEDFYDRIMTGWDEVSPVAGPKRQCSPEPQIVHSKRGRPVKKLDYYKLHHGKVVKTNNDPKTWSEAMSSHEARNWQQAAKEEYGSLRDTETIQIIKSFQLSKGRTPMKCKWVFKKKYLADGSLDKYKARCTVKGFTQRSGIDYKETYALTPSSETGRIMLALVHRFGWHRCQGDVPAAFLNPDLDVDLYMEMPEGFKKEGYIIRI
ncbi:hypothetical protein K3495_g1527 [Podosphaera aphanis]|nr:hypothetical protein K3495_g1527 [Podosphaera aphanis]